MSESNRKRAEDGPPADAEQETSLLRVLVYPLLMFVVGPALVVLALKYLMGV